MDLRARAAKALAWHGSTRLGMQVISWGVTIYVARQLTPDDYGLFGMAIAVIGFLELFQELGLGSAIVQRPDMAEPDYNAIFWAVFGFSLLLAALTLGGAGGIAWFYGEPRVVPLLRALALAFVVGSLGVVPYSLLTKEIDFRGRSLAEASAVIASAIVAPTLAYLGYGVWALIVAHIVRTTVQNAAYWYFSGWIPGVECSSAKLSEALRFGLHVTGSVTSRTLGNFVNTVIIARFLGGGVLGLYTMANTLANESVHKLSTTVINQLSFPIFSKLQNDKAQLRAYFSRITKYLLIVSLPVQMGLAIVATDFVALVLSDQWMPIVNLLRAFCIGGIFYALPLPATPLLIGVGKAERVFKILAVATVFQAAAFLVGAQFGMNGLIVAWLVGFPLPRVLLLRLALGEVGLTWSEFSRGLVPTFLATALMAVAVLALPDEVLGAVGSADRLLVEVSTGAVVYIAALLIFDRGLGGEVRKLVQMVTKPSTT